MTGDPQGATQHAQVRGRYRGVDHEGTGRHLHQTSARQGRASIQCVGAPAKDQGGAAGRVKGASAVAAVIQVQDPHVDLHDAGTQVVEDRVDADAEGTA